MFGKIVADGLRKIAWRERRQDALVDAYARTVVTGRSLEEERRLVFTERNLGDLDE